MAKKSKLLDKYENELIFEENYDNKDIIKAKQKISRLIHRKSGKWRIGKTEYRYFRVIYVWLDNMGNERYTGLPKTSIGQYPYDSNGNIIRGWQLYLRSGINTNNNFKYEGMSKPFTNIELIKVVIIYYNL